MNKNQWVKFLETHDVDKEIDQAELYLKVITTAIGRQVAMQYIVALKQGRTAEI